MLSPACGHLDKTTWGMGWETCIIWSVDTTPGVSFDLHACHYLIHPLVLIKSQVLTIYFVQNSPKKTYFFKSLGDISKL